MKPTNESSIPPPMRSRCFLATWLHITQVALWLGLCMAFFVLCFSVWYFFLADSSSLSHEVGEAPPTWSTKAEVIGLILVAGLAIIWILRSNRRALKKLKAAQSAQPTDRTDN